VAGFPNGQIPRSALPAIPGGLLQADAAESWNDMRAEVIRRGGPVIGPKGSESTYRDLAGQRKWRTYWCGLGLCYKAAVPGTSNHGLGLAVDVTKPSEAALLEFGPRFGWSHAEGASVDESWHFKFVGPYTPSVDPQHVLTSTERGWLEELRQTKSRARKQELGQKIRLQRHVILREAKKTGWDRKHRRERYELLGRFI
jgi:hypothetical protein